MVDISNPEPQTGGPEGTQNCIFCHIISGSVPSKEVYSDSKVKAVLDINPANTGHVLVIPKQHFMLFPQVPDDLLAHMAMVAKAISKACIRTLKAQGTNVFIANGAAAGQRAQHVMVHVVPRKEGDGVQAFTLPHRQMPEAQYAKFCDVLRPVVAKAFGMTVAESPAMPASAPAPVMAPKQVPPPPQPAAKPSSVQTPEPSTVKPVDLDHIADLLSGRSRATEPEPEHESASGESLAFIASKRGGKFHMPNCPFIAKINPENRITIADTAEARKRELKPCECVP